MSGCWRARARWRRARRHAHDAARQFGEQLGRMIAEAWDGHDIQWQDWGKLAVNGGILYLQATEAEKAGRHAQYLCRA